MMQKTFSFFKRFWLLLLALLCLFTAAARIGGALAYNANHIGLFRAHSIGITAGHDSENSAYKKGIPMEEMDFAQVFYDATGINGVAYTSDPGLWKIHLPCTVRYYDAPNGNVVYEIPKGTEVYVDLVVPFLDHPYAFNSYPTYTAGWRYCTPFLKTADHSGDNWHELRHTGTPQYVRLDTLLRVAESAFLENEAWLNFYEENTLKESTSHPEKVMARILTLYIDWQMHATGYYTSPDIYHPVLDGVSIALLACGASLLMVHFLRKRKRKAL